MNRKSGILRHGSMFSGIGGFDLAADWCGWINAFHCEINEFCTAVLNYYWPKAKVIKNIIGYAWQKWKGKIDVLSGGWPCQRYSVAGDRQGEEPLKMELLKAIRLIRPAWCVLENVYGFLTKRFASEHLLLCEQLEGMGYDVQTFDIDAASCGIPTVERHIWVVAAPRGQRLERYDQKKISDFTGSPEPFQRGHQRAFDRWRVPESRVCGVGEGVPGELDTGALSKSKWHKESLKAFGNAIVPQIAYYLFKCINWCYECQKNKKT